MKKKWINKQKNASCLLFFHGWGMDESSIRHLSCRGMDVCMFYDYSSCSALKKKDFSHYKLHVAAWSLGVSVAHAVLSDSELDVAAAVAINGTPFPFHDQYGIPVSIFRKTEKTWSENNRQKFYVRMFGGIKNYKTAAGFLSEREIENQKRELQFFLSTFADPYMPGIFSWDKAYAGSRDYIIPFRNQADYWKGKTELLERDESHFPFFTLNAWEELF